MSRTLICLIVCFLVALTLAIPHHRNDSYKTDDAVGIKVFEAVPATVPLRTYPIPRNATMSSPKPPKPSYHPTCFPSTHEPKHYPVYPAIRSLLHCGRAARALLSNRYSSPTEPQTWTPIRHEWVFQSCGISLMPNNVFSVDLFSRGEIAAAALQVKSACVNQEHGWKGGEILIGYNRAFEVELFGVGAPYRQEK